MKGLIAFILALTLCGSAWSSELFGTVDAVYGIAYVSDQSGKQTGIGVGTEIYEGQTINSGADGEVHIQTADGGIIAIRPNTTFHIDEYKADGGPDDKMFMSLFAGAIRSITGWIGKHNPSAYLITTPSDTIGIRGTDHETAVIDKGDGDKPGTYETVYEGETVLKNQQGEVDVKPGKFAFSPSHGLVAPLFLAKRPHFFALRKLKIENSHSAGV